MLGFYFNLTFLIYFRQDLYLYIYDINVNVNVNMKLNPIFLYTNLSNVFSNNVFYKINYYGSNTQIVM
jgi:hypothetical protein